MKPDVIVCWPCSHDYPLWRQFIRDNRERFAKVIVVFTEHEGLPLSGWVQAHFPDVMFLDTPSYRNVDWRDEAVNYALNRSTAEWVWFTEQDFFIYSRWFWVNLAEMAEEWPAIGWQERGSKRWHPSCLFVKRPFIEATSRYFGPDPIDHFYRFGRELGPVAELVGAGVLWEHLQGLTQNHSLIDAGQSEGIFKRERFRRYLADCLKADVPLEAGWVEAARRELEGANDEVRARSKEA